MAQTIVAVKPASSRSGASGVSRYIAESKRDPEKEGLEQGEARPLFSSDLDDLDYHQANEILGEAYGDNAQSREVIHLVISLEPEQFETAGDTLQEQKDELKEATRDAGKEIAQEVGAEELHWIAGIHLNTDHPHVHIAISREGRAVGGQFLRIDHLPRTLLPHHEPSAESEKTFKPGLIAEAVALHLEHARERRRSDRPRDETRGQQTLEPTTSQREVEPPVRTDSHSEQTAHQEPQTLPPPDRQSVPTQQPPDTRQSGPPDVPSDTSRQPPPPVTKEQQDREILGRAMVVAAEVEKLGKEVESLIEHGDKRRFRVYDASHDRTRQISHFDVHRRAEARAATTVREKEIIDPDQRHAARNSYYQAEIDQHAKALHDHRIIVAKTLTVTQRKLTAASEQHAQLQAQVRGIIRRYSSHSQPLPTALLTRYELSVLQNQAISNGNPSRVKTLERIRESLAIEHNSPTRTDKETARLEGQLLVARAEQAARLARLQQFEQNKHQTRWQIGNEKQSLVNIDRMIADKESQSKFFGSTSKGGFPINFFPSSRQAAAAAATELKETREIILGKIDDRKTELAESFKSATTMTETLATIFNGERQNQQERHWQSQQRGEFPERLEKELTRSEITRLVDHSLALADPAMMQQALILESQHNERQDEKTPLLEQSSKASGREILGNIALKEAQDRQAAFTERKDFVPVMVKDLEGRDLTARAFDYREPLHPIKWLMARLGESKNDRHLRREVEKAVEFQGEQFQQDVSNFQACQQLLASTAEHLRDAVKVAGHEPPDVTFTTKQIMQLEIYAQRQQDPNERDRIMSLINHAEETHHVFTPLAYDSKTVTDTLLRDTPLDPSNTIAGHSHPEISGQVTQAPAHSAATQRQDELSPTINTSHDDVDLTH